MKARWNRFSLIGGVFLAAIVAFVPAAQSQTLNMFTSLSDEVTGKMLEGPVFAKLVASRKRARLVVGDVRNNSDDESVRVEDIYNEIRNRVVERGDVRLFSSGELDVDYIISPQLTSAFDVDAKGRRMKCFTLQLTLSTVAGEYIAAYQATRCR